MFYTSKDMSIVFLLNFLLKEKTHEAVENIESVIAGVGCRFHPLLALEQKLFGLCFLVYQMEVSQDDERIKLMKTINVKCLAQRIPQNAEYYCFTCFGLCLQLTAIQSFVLLDCQSIIY